MNTSPFQNRDLTKILSWPSLSWSSFSAFRDYGKDEWYMRYVLGHQLLLNPALIAGQKIGERLAIDPDYLPEVPRPEIFEQELKAKLGTIQLVGHMDGWSPSVPGIDEIKTSQNATRWTQKSADAWGQLTFYCLLVWLNYKIPPEKLKLRLIYIPVVMDGSFEVIRSKYPVQVFHTKRTMRDVLAFGAELRKVYREMELFVKNRKL